MRLVALGLAAAAAFALPGAASANDLCVPGAAGTDVCVAYTCTDHHCIGKKVTTVYTTCEHPFFTLCRRIVLPSL